MEKNINQIMEEIHSEFTKMIRDDFGGEHHRYTPTITLKGLVESEMIEIASNLKEKRVCGRYSYCDFQFGKEFNYSFKPTKKINTLKISIDAEY